METGSCEMCGREGLLLQSRVEGTVMNLCSKCARFGTILDYQQEKPKTRMELAGAKGPEITYTQDFHTKIKKAREQKNLTQAELAHALAEKESTITKIEAGHYTPEIKLARKLEQFLGIKLTETYTQTTTTKTIDFKDSGLTIGDLLKKK